MLCNIIILYNIMLHTPPQHETECLNSEQFKKTIGWLQMLQGLIESCQDHEDPSNGEVIRGWEEERDVLRWGWGAGCVLLVMYLILTVLNLIFTLSLMSFFRTDRESSFFLLALSCRKDTKEMFNTHFGSVFRTHDNPTYFSRRLFRFADVYTSRLTNLNNYSSNHTFFPRRGVLPHEYKSLFV